MKNYKQILKAVNRGIKFALDDFEDDTLQGQTNSKIKYQGGINEYLDLKKEVVDLELPSGTLWCKYNLGVDSNQLTESGDWYGDYYAWGELKPNKSEFSWSTYKYAEHYTDLSETDCLTKYCNDPQKGYNQITKTWGFTDNLAELLPEDDVAYQKKKLHNYKFRIPTKEQFEELINYTNNYWIKNYDPDKTIHNQENDDGGIKGLNGIIFEGQNGNQMFIPAAGYRDGTRCRAKGFNCDLWAGTLDISAPHKACGLYFSSFRISSDPDYRYYGFNIRPVINL